MQAAGKQGSTVQTAPTGSQYLSFALGAEVYGVDILRVQEIRGWEPVRPLPDMPAHIKGVLDLRGTIVPVFDLRVRFGTAVPEYLPTTVVIVMHVRDRAGGSQVVGAVVDAVSDVLDVSGEALRSAPSLGSCIGARYLHGMVSLERGMVILLDVDRLFDETELHLVGETR